MTHKTRQDLKNTFITGAKPHQKDFSDWLDNYVHQDDLADATNKTGQYYVSRSYTGTGGAVVVAVNQFPTSANASYNTQLQQAARNNLHKPYPDPYAARAAAMQDLAAGLIQKAFIYVSAGNRWTVGSDNPAYNGDSQANALNPEVADIQFASTYVLNEASLLQHKLVVYFDQDAGFDYINAKYPILLGYVYNPNSTTTTQMAIEGKGKMVQLYGQKQGFSAYLINTNDPNLTVSLSFGTLFLNQYHSFSYDNVAHNRLQIESVYCYEANFIQAYSNIQSAIYKEQVHEISIKSIMFGNRYSWFPMGGATTDYWYLFSITKAIVPTTVNINVGTVIIDGSGATPLLRTTVAGQTANSLSVNLHVDVLKHSFYGAAATTLISSGFASACQNKHVTVNIRNGYSEQGLVTAYGAYFYDPGANNSFVRIHCDNMAINMVNAGPTPYAVINDPTWSGAPHTNCHTSISGNYSLTNCGMYTNASPGAPNGTLVIFEDATILMNTNSMTVFNIAEKTEKTLALKNVTVKCGDLKLFANTSGGTPSVYIQNVYTTDTTVNDTITYEGDTIKTIPQGYFK